jgi:hypothetical protein
MYPTVCSSVTASSYRWHGTWAVQVKPVSLARFALKGIRLWFIQMYFCDGKRRDAVPEAVFQKDASRNGVSEPFIHGIGLTRSGLSCFPTALLSNKLSYFVEFLKENYPRPNFGGLYASRNGFLQRNCTGFIQLQCIVAGHDKNKIFKDG